MKKYLLIILIILTNYSLLLPQASLDSLCEKWNALDKLILNQKIDKDAAIRMLERYENDIIKYFKKNNISTTFFGSILLKKGNLFIFFLDVNIKIRIFIKSLFT